MSKKMTKKEMFAQIMANYNLTVDETAFIEREIELLNNRKKSDKPTAKQTENDGYKTAILEYLTEHAEEKFTITEIWHNVAVLADNEAMSNQRVSALVRQLKEDNLVVKEDIKRKAYFSIATE